jgi:hypothetical protein
MKEEYIDHEYVLAKPEQIWDILTDVKDWPLWQVASHVEPPAGPLCEGATFQAELSGRTWQITVTEADRPHRLVWVGRTRGLSAVHEWSFVREAVDTSEVVTKETVSGWMLPLAYPLTKRRIARDDARWLTDLTRMAENRWVEHPKPGRIPAQRRGAAVRHQGVRLPLASGGR